MTDDLDCKAVSRMLSDGLDRELPASDQVRLRMHLAICETCRHVRDQMKFLSDAMRRLGSASAPRGPKSRPDD
jgi:predicted anti-sigma-YlaC factor YlaD